MTEQAKLSAEILEITRLSKADVSAKLKEMGVTFNADLTLPQLRELAITSLMKKEVKAELEETFSDETKLKQAAAKILEDAAEHNSIIEGFSTPEEKTAYIDSIEEEFGIGEIFRNTFPEFEFSDAVVTADDLPASDIITALPIRVVEQAIQKIMVTYQLLSLVKTETVRNGVKQLLYQDYRDTDNESGFADVKIGDYNPGSEPVFSEVEKVDTEVHKGYAILSSVLNDVTVTPGLFVALINNYIYAIARPVAKTMYKRFVAWLDKDANFDIVKSFDSADIKEQSKELFTMVTSIQTPSRKHLKSIPQGASEPLEFQAKSSELNVVLNLKFAAKYKYDLSAGTFQIGEIKFPVKSITVVDFDKVLEYTANPNASKFADNEVLVLQDGVYNEMFHYDAAKTVDTPKLKTVFHRFIRLGNYKPKNKISMKIKKHV